MREMAPGNANKMGSTVTTQVAMGLPQRLAYEKLVRRPKNETLGVNINTCSDSSPTGS
jgi:hypothetical protein